MKPCAITVKRVRPLLGTFVEIELRAAAGEASLQRWITRGFKAVETIDRLMSIHRPDSEISRLNRLPAGRWLRVHPLTLQVLTAANHLHFESDGIFDIRRPSGHPRRSGVAPLQIQGGRVRKTGAWILDLDGIAKGFAVDHAVACMRRQARDTALSGMVNAGGDLRVWGQESQRFAVRCDGPNPAYGQTFEAARIAAATSAPRSGLTQRHTQASFWTPQGTARFGQPETVTVFADRCVVADALTKVVLLAEPDVADRCLVTYGARALITSKNGQTRRVLG